MANKSRVFIICLLLGLAGLFFYLHYRKPAPEPVGATQWTFRIKDRETMQPFICKAGKYYTFRAGAGIAWIRIDGQRYRADGVNRTFVVSFPRDTGVQVQPYTEGMWLKRGSLQVSEGKQFIYPEIVLLMPNEYSPFSFKVKKGAVYEIDQQREVYFVGFFQGEHLIEQNMARTSSNFWITCWHDSQMRFRAGEVPFLFIVKKEPYYPGLVYKYGTREDHDFSRTMNKEFPDAYFLRAGEEVKTPVWLDKGDEVYVRNKIGPLRVICSVEGNDPSEPEKSCENHSCGYEAKESGYLRLQSAGLSVITEIAVKHRKNWHSKLKDDEEEQIDVFEDDVIRTRSDSRYYVNGNIMEPGRRQNHYVPKDGYLTLKAGLDPKPIFVEIVSRRGF